MAGRGVARGMGTVRDCAITSRVMSWRRWSSGEAGLGVVKALGWIALCGWCGGGCAKSPAPAASPKATASSVSAPAPAVAASVDALRLCGSSTIGAELAPELALQFLAHLGAKDATVTKKETKKNETIVEGHLDDRPIAVHVDYRGSSEAFEGLLNDRCDIGLASRPILEEEAEKLAELGDMTSPRAEHVIAMDGIAIVVEKSNPLRQLTVAQIARIFSGEIKNWSELGGAPGPIHVYGRDERSGTFETFAHLALADKPLTAAADLFDDNEGLASALAKDARGIGFVGLSAASALKVLAVQDGRAPAIAPTAFTVSTEEYPFSRRLFLYVSERIRPILAQRFVDFAFTEAGEAAIASSGFVPLKIDAIRPPARRDAPPAYVKATRGAHRLSFVFRFKANGTALENRSARDVGRLAAFVSAGERRQGPVSLLSFTDATGSVKLSRERAERVAELLRDRGVSTGTVEGFGPALAVASNDTEVGRRKNNRVEVWVP